MEEDVEVPFLEVRAHEEYISKSIYYLILKGIPVLER